ncbi:MAG: Tim44/TimA family putative adaptor protein [Rhodospirillales bacterium]
MEAGFPIDILLFAMIAVYLVFRLRNVLGRRDGHEGKYHDPFSQSPDSPDSSKDDAWAEPDDNVVHLTDQSGEQTEEAPAVDGRGALRDGILAIQRLDPGFNPDEFLTGAGQAFEMILNAYAEGDTQTLKSLLSAEVYGNFTQAIRDREQAGEALEDTLVGIDKATVLEAWVEGRVAYVTVKFVSQQINVTRDENGDVVDGDANTVISVTDFWTFSRDTRSSDPNWALVATQSAD